VCRIGGGNGQRPVELLVGEAGVYAATVEPPTATLPIELVWSNGLTGTSAVYSWTMPGNYTVAGDGDELRRHGRGERHARVAVAPLRTYLPIVMKNE